MLFSTGLLLRTIPDGRDPVASAGRVVQLHLQVERAGEESTCSTRNFLVPYRAGNTLFRQDPTHVDQPQPA